MLLGMVLSLVAALLPLSGVLAKGSTTQEPSQPFFVLTVEDDTLSAQIKEVPLKTVLEKLAQQIPLQVSFRGEVGEKKISATFEDLPLEAGIKRLLRGTSYTLISAEASPAGGAEAPRKTLEIRVAASGTGTTDKGAGKPDEETQKAAKGEPKKSLEELIQQALHAPEARDRVKALQALHDQFEEKQVLPTYLAALEDKSEEVRLAALRFLMQAQGPLPPSYDRMANLALKDSSLEVRRHALKLATEIDEKASLDLLKKALDDPDPSVSRLAKVMLKVKSLPLPDMEKLRSDQAKFQEQFKNRDEAKSSDLLDPQLPLSEP